MLLAAAVLAVLGLCAGAAVPGSANADDDDDDNGDNGGNYQRCSQAGGGTQQITKDPLTGKVTAVMQVCVITTSPGVCIQHATAPVVVQQCLVNQGLTAVPTNGMPTNNSLFVAQTADQRGAEATSTAPLDATQIVDGPSPLTRGEQRNFGTGNNTAYITQVIKQVLASGIDDDDDGEDDDDNGEADEDDDGEDDDDNGEADEDDDGEEDDDNGEENGPADLTINQFEQAHQSVDLCQGGIPCENFAVMFGRNKSIVYQSQKQHEFAANAAVVNQGQNVVARDHECSPGPVSGLDDPTARTCYTIKQYTSNTSQSLSNPANYSKLSQYSEQLQNVRNAAGGSQLQGEEPLFGGLDHNFVQFTPPGATSGIALLLSDQDEYQTQRKKDSDFIAQDQFGNLRKGSGTQDSNPNSLVDIEQDKTQYQGEGPPPSEQTGAAQAFAETSGDCVADVTVTQNGESESASEPSGDAGPGPDVCNVAVFCGQFDDDNGGGPFPGAGECISTEVVEDDGPPVD